MSLNDRHDTVQTPCPCGDYYCSDQMPKNQDRSDCCQYCGYYDCDVCGWTDSSRIADAKDEVL